MSINEQRYKTWGDAMLQAFADGDVEVTASKWAEDGSYTSIDPFGEHITRQGREAIYEAMEEMFARTEQRHVLKNELLSAADERGILNAWVKWKAEDSAEVSCNFIYIVALDEDNRCISYQEWNVVDSKDTNQ
jgi:hypothetical protein